METLPSSNYPLPSQASLQLQYIGKSLLDVPTPAVIIDRAVVKRNCNAMLQACSKLGVNFRAHVKSHKTLELAKLQVGSDVKKPADFVVSTLVEAENLLPFMLECVANGRPCSILYGVPIPQSTLPRLFRLASLLPSFTIHIIIDNISALNLYLSHYHTFSSSLSTQNLPPKQIGIFIKIDTGYHRAGIQTSSPAFASLANSVVDSGNFKGFYSHYGHSYAGSSEEEAATGLIEELQGLDTACLLSNLSSSTPITLTVGATPTATAAQNMLSSSSPKVAEFIELLNGLKKRYNVEFHAGVYPLLDMQQLATKARPALPSYELVTNPGFEPLSKSNIGMKVLVEVTSVYTERSKPEALISAGSFALGREPCKSYPGWGVVSSELGNKQGTVYDEGGERQGWIVGRISQEHGILTWEGDKKGMKELEVGGKLLVWPNHACVAGAGFGWYLVVDWDMEDCEYKVVDVWVRWRGW